jgi:hypothetical protein
MKGCAKGLDEDVAGLTAQRSAIHTEIVSLLSGCTRTPFSLSAFQSYDQRR